jgi:hypothetical protein
MLVFKSNFSEKNMNHFLISFFIFSLFLNACSENSNYDINDNNYTKTDYINCINMKELDLPASLNLIIGDEDSLSYKTINYSDSLVFLIYIKNSNIDTLKIIDAEGFAVYKEGDIDGDGFEEIGIMNAYPASSCRTYSIYGVENNKWKEKYNILTHLADRELGVNYFRNMGDKLRIIQPKRDICCQCYGLDTSFIRY